MFESAWVADENGVMVFKPSTSLPSFTEAQRILSSSENEQDYVHMTNEHATLNSERSSSGAPPSQDIQLVFRVKSEPMDVATSKDLTPSDTMSVGSGYLNFSPSPALLSSSDSYHTQTIFDQMKSIAATSSDTSLDSNLRLTNISLLSSDNILHSESEHTPCPVRNKVNVSRSSTKSRVFRKNKVMKCRKAEILRPSWIKTLGSRRKTSGTSQQAKTKNVLSLEHLQDIERGPKHYWTTNERITLLSLHRWYISSNSEFRDLFNSLTGLTMKHATLTTQLACGGTPFNKVRCPFYSIPFDDPENVYKNIRGHIESRASDLGIKLRCRVEPEPHKYEQDGLRETGWTTNSTELSPRGHPQLRQSSAQNDGQKPLGGYAIPDKDFNDDEELVGIEVAPTPLSSTESQYFPETSATSCHLAFRCWDDENWTTYNEDIGFTAAAFQWLGGPLEEHPPQNCPMLMMALARPHLSVKGGVESCYISLFTSLLQMMAFSAKKTNPTICIVNLDHPTLEVPGKKQAAQPIVKELKRHGEMSWARYQATQEYLIYAQLPKSAILHRIQLGELERLATEDLDVSRLLNLQLFTEKSSTRTVSERLRKERLILNPNTARAMGKVARVFGLGGSAVTKLHISDFVTCLTDGWAIRADPSHDIHTMADLANRFAIALGPRNPSLHIQDIIAAFMDGFERGTQNLARFSRRRPQAKCHRTN